MATFLNYNSGPHQQTLTGNWCESFNMILQMLYSICTDAENRWHQLHTSHPTQNSNKHKIRSHYIICNISVRPQLVSSFLELPAVTMKSSNKQVKHQSKSRTCLLDTHDGGVQPVPHFLHWMPRLRVRPL